MWGRGQVTVEISHPTQKIEHASVIEARARFYKNIVNLAEPLNCISG